MVPLSNCCVGNKILKLHRVFAALTIAILSGCGTYYDPGDSYVRGVRFYDRGDYVTAKHIWEPLAQDGDCDAAFRMGLLYISGEAVIADVETARTWWAKAANQGQPRAQLALGDFYASGNFSTRFVCHSECVKDSVTAYKWYLLGARFAGYDNDKAYATHAVAEIRQELTDLQRQEGEQLAANWKPSANACETRVLM